MREETFAITPRFGYTAPVSSMTSSEKGYSLSLTTKGALIIFSRWRSTSAEHMAFPSESSTSRRGVSNLRRSSRGKCFLPWKYPQNSWWTWVSTDMSLRQILLQNDRVLSQHLWAQSWRIAQHHSSPKFSSFCTFSWNVTVAEAHLCRSRCNLCHWCCPTEEEHGMTSVLLAPIFSKLHLILWTANVRERVGNGKKYQECE